MTFAPLQTKPRFRHLLLLLAGAAAVSAVVAHAAPGTFDGGKIDLEPFPSARPIDPAAEVPRALSGNPLWAIPLGMLNITRERPLFLPSRRAPAPAVAAVRTEPAPPPPPPPPPVAAPPQIIEERPSLSLVGVVTGSADGFAVFVNETTRDIVRLRTGEGHDGWILNSVQAREAVLEKNHRTVVMELPSPVGDRK